MTSKIGCRARSFIRDARGSIAVAFAIAALGIAGALGAAVDYSNATRLRTAIAGIADAAALAAARDATRHINVAGATTDSVTEAELIARQVAAQFVAANVPAELRGMGIASHTTVTTGRLSVEVTVALTARVPNTLLGAIGMPHFDIRASATTVQNPQRFVQVLFLLDVSQSMGIGGTDADIRTLERHPRISCAFACHDPNGTHGSNTRQIARMSRIDLKIDYLRRATEAFIDRLVTLSGDGGNNYFVGMYTFGSEFAELQPPTNDLTTARRRAAMLDMEPARWWRVNGVDAYGWSDLASAMTQLNARMTRIGDGSSQNDMLTYVVIVSDGLQDIPAHGFPYQRNTNVNYERECRLLQRSGQVEVFNIHARTPTMHHHAYNVLVAPHQDGIARVMRACSSFPGHYFLATDGPAVQAAIDSVARSVTNGPRLSR